MLRPALIVHGGAGTPDPLLAEDQRRGCLAALERGWALLVHGGDALAAVCEAVAVLEDDPTFNAGIGSCLTAEGTVEMDASVMEGTRLRAGAVGVVGAVPNPVRLARAVLEEGRSVLLCGPATETYARVRSLPTCRPQELVTERQMLRWKRRQSCGATVGAAAVDGAGHVAAATSTGGILGKEPGRVGDSAVIGAGTYADDEGGAVSATGDGEAIIRIAMAKRAVDALRAGGAPDTVATEAIAHLEARAQGHGGVVIVDASGRVGYAFNTAHMTVGYMRADLGEAVAIV
jgi:beta-aspartyl-peptidase (threonine type)